MCYSRPVCLIAKYVICLLLALMVLGGTAVKEARAAYYSPVDIDHGFEWITHVSFGDLVDNSIWVGTNGYSYSGLTATVTKGGTYSLATEIDPHPTAWYNEYVYAWIDWNGNTNWSDDGGPIILANGTHVAGPHTQNITVPASAMTGTTRMRISLKFGSPPTHDGDYFEGEVKDYDVQILSGDSTTPSAITDLATSAVTASSIALNWTAPGDDGSSGTATSYDVRYATFIINDTNWASTTAAVGEPAPQAAGSLQSFIVTGLDPGTTYYFAIKTTDEAANESGLSNIASGMTDSASFCGSGNLVMVTDDGTFDTRYDNQKRTLFQSWGYSVTVIEDEADPSTFSAAAAANDVMYISETVDSGNMGARARDLDIGIVLEQVYLADEMAFVSSGNEGYTLNDHIVILDNSHHITSGFSLGNLPVYTVTDEVTYNDTTWASGGWQLARTPSPLVSPTIYAFETGDSLVSGHTAANRRVSTHFFNDTDPVVWHDNLKTLLRRSLEWASCGSGAVQYSISGRVFEDTTYGGGNGRSYAVASGTARSGVRVELYNSSGGYITFDNTDASGNYTFSGLSAGTYGVRVVNATVTSTRSGANGSEVAVQTYRIDGDAEAVGTGSSKVGGEQPQSVDAPANNGSQTLGNLQSPVGQYTQSLVTVDASSISVSDVDFGFNFDTIVNTNNSGQGSLRQFILNANLLGGTQTSQFMIPTSDTRYNGSGNGEYSISPSTALPTLTATVILDGSTQTGNMGDTNANGPEIELSGNLLGAVSGLVITSSANGCIIRGLTINEFDEDGIDIHSNSNTIQGNYIGTDVTGSLSRGNGDDGINVESGDGNKIGGENPGDGNLISGNLDDGINLRVGAEDNIIQGNYIGTNAAGTAAVANADNGILVHNLSHDNLIGGISVNSANRIAHNGGAGVLVYNSLRCSIIGNAIHTNDELGIDLSLINNQDGVTANDTNDSDGGPNDMLNYPVITSSTASGGSITIDYDLDLPAGTYRIEFFNNALGADPSGYGEGENLADAASITHTGGNLSFSHSVPGAAGDIITATATVESSGDYGATSEFCAAFTATAVPVDITLNKIIDLVSDPFNNTTNPKMIPGAVLNCTVTVTNQGLGDTDPDSVIITNPIDNDTALYVGDLSGSGSAIIFQNGSPSSGLTFNNSQITFSNNNGSSFDYAPSGGMDYDPAVTHLRVSPSGAFNASDGSNHPNFTLQYRVRVQ